ncbi:unnamed protein product [Echinostoma caproni]|uniref:HMG box domain-containing protein n=1 Tax=Echinostoma caproni TaxID=27848 RepID=A0A183B819_9TREM|nr:unnamed protein product [Echinostoma caproni]
MKTTPDELPSVTTAVTDIDKQMENCSNEPESSESRSFSKFRRASSLISSSRHVRRPMNAFILFSMRHRGEVHRLYPNKDNRVASQILGEWWYKLSAEEKAEYQKLARELKAAHFRHNPDWRWSAKERRRSAPSTTGNSTSSADIICPRKVHTNLMESAVSPVLLRFVPCPALTTVDATDDNNDSEQQTTASATDSDTPPTGLELLAHAVEYLQSHDWPTSGGLDSQDPRPRSEPVCSVADPVHIIDLDATDFFPSPASTTEATGSESNSANNPSASSQTVSEPVSSATTTISASCPATTSSSSLVISSKLNPANCSARATTTTAAPPHVVTSIPSAPHCQRSYSLPAVSSGATMESDQRNNVHEDSQRSSSSLEKPSSERNQ